MARQQELEKNSAVVRGFETHRSWRVQVYDASTGHLVHGPDEWLRQAQKRLRAWRKMMLKSPVFIHPNDAK